MLTTEETNQITNCIADLKKLGKCNSECQIEGKLTSDCLECATRHNCNPLQDHPSTQKKESITNDDQFNSTTAGYSRKTKFLIFFGMFFTALLLWNWYTTNK